MTILIGIMEVLLAQFSLYVHTHVLKLHSFHFIVIKLTLCSNESNFLLLPPGIDHRLYTVILGYPV